VYAGMALCTELYQYAILFFLYGIYAAATESIAKAWISNLSNKKDTATAIGTYTGLQSVCAMMASAWAGWIWLMFGPAATFLFSSAITFCILVYFILMVPSPSIAKK
jgi:MFS family permease